MILELSVKLKRLRIERHLRQGQVAQLIGVSKAAISAYETDIRQPSYDVLIRLANLYNVSVDYLLGRSNVMAIDISGLTASEVAIINRLVISMSEKNRKMEELRT